ncbi:hypothetical protein BY458DRAFT_501836 [Sporodiniella umbellata]|nr:hypothetical protein BY458DRAFT_501836 [Sporodiniella umbellata]
MNNNASHHLPSLSNLLVEDSYFQKRVSHRLSVASLLSPNETEPEEPIKVKRKRASPWQLHKLNRIFEQTRFPSTELRIELGKSLGMSSRTVQIWFQNKRQSIRNRTCPGDKPIRHHPLPSLSLPLPPPFTFPFTPSSSNNSSPNEFKP